MLENTHLSDAFLNASGYFTLEHSVRIQNGRQRTQSLEKAVSEAWPGVPHAAEGWLTSLSSGERPNSCFLLACLAVFWLTYAHEGQDPVEKMDLEETLKRHLFLKRCCSSTAAASDSAGGRRAAAPAAVLPSALRSDLVYI